MSTTRSRVLAASAAAAVLVSLGAGGAVAANKIDGHDIKQATIGIDKLTGPLHARINAPGPSGAAGAKGATGATGAKGDQGPAGAAGSVGSAGENGAQGAQGEPGAQGEQGAKGAQGEQGAQGPAGADGVSGYEIVAIEATVPAGTFGFAKAECPSGKLPLGGGYVARNGVASVYQAQPETNGYAVRTLRNDQDAVVLVRAVCATVS